MTARGGAIGYVHRRLRKRRGVTVLRFTGGQLSAEVADRFRARWQAARRSGVVIVDSRWEVREVGR